MPGDGRTSLERPGSSAEAPAFARPKTTLKTGDKERNRECDEVRGHTRRYEEIRGEQCVSEEMQRDTRSNKEIRGNMRR